MGITLENSVLRDQSAKATDYSIFKGRMVDLTLRGDEGATETIQGTVIEGNPLGLIFKPRSQRNQDLVESYKIESIEFAASTSKLKLITAKELRPVVPVTVRRHLADYHGYKVPNLNKMSDEAAMREHAEIDHTDLGHNHNGTGENKRRAGAKADPEREEILARIDELGRTA